MDENLSHPRIHVNNANNFDDEKKMSFRRRDPAAPC